MLVIVKEIKNDTTLLVEATDDKMYEVQADKFYISEMKELLSKEDPVLIEIDPKTKTIK